ncbi:MAG: GNAT family N-acetyltransferase [Hyphomicrobiales bacterium]|nr:GNAT family N-acetyltransferase [Hyphomicrobiales bacterium]
MEIKVRHVHAEDYHSVHQIMLTDRVIRGTMRLPYQSLEHTRARLEPAEGATKLVAYSGDEVVGYCELGTYPDIPRHRHVGEIAMVAIHEAWRGKGVGRALMTAMIDLADNWLQLTRLSLIVWTTNTEAIELYQNFGFALEGTMPGYVFCEGKFIDAHIMGRLNRV